MLEPIRRERGREPLDLEKLRRRVLGVRPADYRHGCLPRELADVLEPVSGGTSGIGNVAVVSLGPAGGRRRMVVSESFFVLSGRMIFVPVGSVSAMGTIRGPMFMSFNSSLPLRTALFRRSMSSS